MISRPAAEIRSPRVEPRTNRPTLQFGSKQSSPPARDGANGIIGSGRFDGMDNVYTNSTNSSSSSSSGSPNISHDSPRGAMHHTLHQTIRQNLNPYFQNTQVIAMGASPAESPLQNPSSMSAPRSMSTPNSTTPTGSPGPLTGFAPLAGTLHSDYAYSHSVSVQHHYDQFPFATNAHSSTAIRG